MRKRIERISGRVEGRVWGLLYLWQKRKVILITLLMAEKLRDSISVKGEAEAEEQKERIERMHDAAPKIFKAMANVVFAVGEKGHLIHEERTEEMEEEE